MFIIQSFQDIWILWLRLLRQIQPVLAISRELANLSKRHNCSCSVNQSLMSLWHVSPLWHKALKPSTDLLSWPTTTLRWPLAPLWPYCWPSTSSEGLFNPQIWACDLLTTHQSGTPPAVQSTLPPSFHSPPWHVPSRGGCVPTEQPARRLLRSASYLASAMLWWQFMGTASPGQLYSLVCFFTSWQEEMVLTAVVVFSRALMKGMLFFT